MNSFYFSHKVRGREKTTHLVAPRKGPRCHSERSEESRSGWLFRVRCSVVSCPPNQSALRSFQSRLADSIKATFFNLPQLLICFSRAMAARISPNTSK